MYLPVYISTYSPYSVSDLLGRSRRRPLGRTRKWGRYYAMTDI